MIVEYWLQCRFVQKFCVTRITLHPVSASSVACLPIKSIREILQTSTEIALMHASSRPIICTSDDFKLCSFLAMDRRSILRRRHLEYSMCVATAHKGARFAGHSRTRRRIEPGTSSRRYRCRVCGGAQGASYARAQARFGSACIARIGDRTGCNGSAVVLGRLARSNSGGCGVCVQGAGARECQGRARYVRHWRVAGFCLNRMN